GGRCTTGCTALSLHASVRCTSGWPSTSTCGMSAWTGSTTTSKSYRARESSSDAQSARIGTDRVPERARGPHHPRVRRSDRSRLRRNDEARARQQVGRYTPGPDDAVLDRPARRRDLPPRLRDRGRNRVLVPRNLPGGRAACPDREDVAVQRLAGYGGGRDHAAARNQRSDTPDDAAGVP